MPEPEPVHEMTEEQKQQQLRGAYDQAGEKFSAEERSWGQRRDRQPTTRAPHFFLPESERDAENKRKKHEHQAETRDVLLERRERDMISGDVTLVQGEQLLAERVSQRGGLAVGQEHHDFDRLKLLPLCGIGKQFYGGRLLCEVALAQFGRQDERGRSIISLGNQMSCCCARYQAHIEVFSECPDQRR